MPPRLAVSIINYRTAELTLGCVRSVLAAWDAVPEAARAALEIVVVDNASGDGSAETIAAWIDGQDGPVRLVRSATNSGFSGGHNQGMDAAPDADWYVVLNSDAILRPDFFAELLPALGAADPRTGFVVPRLEGEDADAQVNCFRFPSPASEFIRGANSGPVTKALARRTVSLGTEPAPEAIEWASFACILLRAEMVRALGPMDEGYFLYFEDAEYFLRARRAGWGVLRLPAARAVHYRGGSGPVKSLARQRARMPDYYYRSRTRFLTQAHGRAGLIAANLAWHAGRALAQTRRLLGKPVNPAAEAEAGDIWIGARDPLAPDRRSQDGG